MPEPRVPAFHLIVERRPLTPAVLKDAMQRLHADAGLDPYSARLLLSGLGLGQAGTDKLEALQARRDALRAVGLRAALVAHGPAPEAWEVREWSASADRILFHTRRGDVRVERGDALLFIPAELGDRLLNKVVRQAQAHPTEPLSIPPEELYRTILASQPVLDVYVRHGEAAPVGPLRFVPGRFSIAPFGAVGTLGSGPLLDRVVHFLKPYGPTCFRLDFGIAPLPGVGLESGEGAEARLKRLGELAMYGRYATAIWTLPDLTRARTLSPASLGAAAEEEKPAPQEAVPPAPLPPPPPADVLHADRDVGRLLRQMKWPHLLGGALMLVLLCTAYASPPTGKEILRVVFYHGAGLFMIAGLFFWAGFKRLSLRRLIQNTPTSKVRSLSAGYIELAGVAERASLLVSPMSGVACVYFRIERYVKQQTKNGTRWTLSSITTSAEAPFYLRDETGRVLLDPHGADLVPTHVQTLTEGSGSGFFSLGDDIKIVEATIPEGAPLYVLGYAVPRAGERVSWRQRLAERLRLLKRDTSRLMRYDTNGNGRIDDDEWEVAVREEEKRVLDERLGEAGRAEGQNELIVQRAPRGEGPFVIAGDSEERLLRRYAWHLAGYAFAGLAFFVAALWFFVYNPVHLLH